MGKVSRQNITPRAWGQGCETWELLANQDVVVFHERMPPGTAELKHYHTKARQFFFVLKGQLTIEIPDGTFVLEVSEGLEIAPGAVHLVQNLSAGETEFLAIASPSTLGDKTLV